MPSQEMLLSFQDYEILKSRLQDEGIDVGLADPWMMSVSVFIHSLAKKELSLSEFLLAWYQSSFDFSFRRDSEKTLFNTMRNDMMTSIFHAVLQNAEAVHQVLTLRESLRSQTQEAEQKRKRRKPTSSIRRK